MAEGDSEGGDKRTATREQASKVMTRGTLLTALYPALFSYSLWLPLLLFLFCFFRPLVAPSAFRSARRCLLIKNDIFHLSRKKGDATHQTMNFALWIGENCALHTDSDPPPMKTKSLTTHSTTPRPQNHPALWIKEALRKQWISFISAFISGIQLKNSPGFCVCNASVLNFKCDW